MPRYSRTEDGEVIEHFDSLEELQAHAHEPLREGSFLGAFLLLVASSVLVYLLFQRFGLGTAEKWVKASVIGAVVVPACIVGYKYGHYILTGVILALAAALAVVAGSFLWSLL